MKHRVHVDRAVIAHVFAERPFRLHVAALVEIALENHLGVGRHQDVVGQALDHRRRFAAERGDQRQFVAGMPHGRRDEIERMRAACEGDRQLFAARDASRVDALEVGRGGDVGAGFVAVAQTQPTASDIAPSGRRIDRVVDRRAQVAAAVKGVVRVERQLGQIDVLAGNFHRVNGCIAGRDFHHRLRVCQALEILVVDFVVGGVERRQHTIAAAGGLGDKLGLLRVQPS